MAAAATDLISDQSDVVLGTIVSLLPTKDGCRTQALSRRWHSIWRSAPLNLDDGGGRIPEKTISDILSGHLGPVRRISITSHDARLSSRRDILASLEDLDLGDRYPYKGCHVLPPSAFPVTLNVATFALFGLPANLAADFPRLERLSLFKVTLTEEILSTVLSGCPKLRSLLLHDTVGSGRLCISSRTLRNIDFHCPQDDPVGSYSSTVKVQELVIEDAPCLERLVLLNPDFGPATVRVVRAPKLEALGQLSSKGTSELHVGTTIFQNLISASLKTTMSTVKILSLRGLAPDLDPVLDFLKFFPCLERLYINLDPYVNMFQPAKNKKIVRKYALPGDPIECLDFHLKKVMLKVYYGKGTEVDFARFFVLNAKVLERIEFALLTEYGDEWMKNQYIELQLEDKASRDARFEFKMYSCSNYRNNKKHKSTVDPFDASFLVDYGTIWEV